VHRSHDPLTLLSAGKHSSELVVDDVVVPLPTSSAPPHASDILSSRWWVGLTRTHVQRQQLPFQLINFSLSFSMS